MTTTQLTVKKPTLSLPKSAKANKPKHREMDGMPNVSIKKSRRLPIESKADELPIALISTWLWIYNSGDSESLKMDCKTKILSAFDSISDAEKFIKGA